MRHFLEVDDLTRAEFAEILRLDPAPGDGLDQAGDAQRFGPHGCAAARGADVRRHAEHGYGWIASAHSSVLLMELREQTCRDAWCRLSESNG